MVKYPVHSPRVFLPADYLCTKALIPIQFLACIYGLKMVNKESDWGMLDKTNQKMVVSGCHKIKSIPLVNFLKKKRNPPWHQGKKNSLQHFEGWYFKIVDPSERHIYAIIPWKRRPFWGFIIGFWHDQKMYRFAAYKGSGLTYFVINDSTVYWIVENSKYILELNAHRTEGDFLQAPTINGI